MAAAMLTTRACMKGGVEAGPGFRAAFRSHRRVACSLQSTTTSRNKLRSGWLRSLFHLFGFGKQQEAASILAAVRAAEPVRHTRADRAGTNLKRWQTRGSIEHEDLGL
jgi:hypothetical protein